MKFLWPFPLLLILVLGFGCLEIGFSNARPSNSLHFSKPTKAVALKTQNNDELKDFSSVTTRNSSKDAILKNGPKAKREIALTFDDAPDSIFTPKILDILKDKGVKATFFVVGWRVKAYPDVVKRIVTEGHVIGNHTFSHSNLTKLNATQFHDQIIKTDQLIEKYTGFTPILVRPPYGKITDSEVQWLLNQHREIVNWNVDSEDWKGLNSSQVTTNILKHVHPGSIILQHSGTGTGGDLSGTVNALPKIIDDLRSEGFKLVTIPELMDPTK